MHRGAKNGNAVRGYDMTSENLRLLARYSTHMGTAILRFRDGKIVEHWGGPHCMRGVGLVPAVRNS